MKNTIRQAFTLAEVLITLGIIGIVAAMTLPGVMTDYKKKEIPVRLLKFSSTLQNAFNLATIDYGPSVNWNFPSMQNDPDQTNLFVNTYIFPYLTGLRACDADEKKCQRIAKSLYGGNGNDRMPVYIFSDGSCFGMITGGSSDLASQLHFTYDYNCLGKPNEYDKDIFTFYLRQREGKAPKLYAGNFPVLNAHSRQDFLELCKNHESTHHGGICAALIEYDGWEIRDDYPWL